MNTLRVHFRHQSHHVSIMSFDYNPMFSFILFIIIILYLAIGQNLDVSESHAASIADVKPSNEADRVVNTTDSSESSPNITLNATDIVDVNPSNETERVVNTTDSSESSDNVKASDDSVIVSTGK